MIETISEELQEQYQVVRRVILTVHIEWYIAKQLFASGNDNIELLDWSANYAFEAIRSALYQSVILAICKLTDPTKMGKFENLSLHRLADAIKDIDCNTEIFIKNCLFNEDTFGDLHNIRNKVFAHFDLKNYDLKSFPGTEKIDKAIEILIKIINRIGKSIWQEEPLLEDISHYAFPRWGDGNALLHKLRKYRESVFAFTGKDKG